jgi:hypothetical protein
MTKKEIKQELLAKKSYFKKGKDWLAEKFNCSPETVIEVFNELKKENKEYRDLTISGSKTKRQVVTYLDKIKDKNPTLVIKKEQEKPKKVLKISKFKGNPDNVLFIGDLHAPFILDGYLEFNLELQKKYDCGTVIFAGDIIDGHSWNFHTHDVDGLSVKDELNSAINQLRDWYAAFPEATVMLGNHDLLISRKAKEYGLSQLFLKYFGDIIDAPKEWKFLHELYRDKVLYIHGSTGNAIKRAKTIRHSVAQGHLHSESFVDWSVSEIDSIFGLQVGAGLDRKGYAFEYGKTLPNKPIISSGVILDKGRLPIIELMSL